MSTVMTVFKGGARPVRGERARQTWRDFSQAYRSASIELFFGRALVSRRAAHCVIGRRCRVHGLLIPSPIRQRPQLPFSFLFQVGISYYFHTATESSTAVKND